MVFIITIFLSELAIKKQSKTTIIGKTEDNINQNNL